MVKWIADDSYLHIYLHKLNFLDLFVAFKKGSKDFGEVAEWLKAHAWKVCIPLPGYRGFESLSLRDVLRLCT